MPTFTMNVPSEWVAPRVAELERIREQFGSANRELLAAIIDAIDTCADFGSTRLFRHWLARQLEVF